MEFDAFLSHNSKDKPQVKVLAEVLKASGVKVWLDEWELPPGSLWQEALEAGLNRSKTVVVLFGPAGAGRWEEPEIQAALDEGARRNKRVIPVLLPGASQDQIESRLFLRQHTWVEFKGGLDDREAIERLVWGITLVNPRLAAAAAGPPAQAEPRAQPARLDPVGEAVRSLAERTRSTNVTFVLGKNFLDASAKDSMPSSLSRRLLAAIQLIGEDYDHLVPPLDLAASYYATRWDESKLEAHMADLLMPRAAPLPGAYAALARLLASLRDRPARRTRMPVEQLVITTNSDTWLERALLSAGMSFSRLVHFRVRRRLLVNQYRNVSVSDRGLLAVASDGANVAADIGDADALDDLIAHQDQQLYDWGEAGADAQPVSALSFGKLQQPIIYKLLGSHDVPLTSTISADHYYDLAWRASRASSIPPKIGEIISNSPVLFLGCGILDSDFRVSYHTLLRNAFEMKGHRRYALCESANADHRDVAQKLGRTSWASVHSAALATYGIELIDAGITPFLDSLREAVAAPAPASG
jgi:hypothetical protein